MMTDQFIHDVLVFGAGCIVGAIAMIAIGIIVLMMEGGK